MQEVKDQLQVMDEAMEASAVEMLRQPMRPAQLKVTLPVARS